MIVLKTKKEMVAYRQKYANQKIGLVATMGGLHQGHFDLVSEIEPFCDLVVVSIFVNPSQFSQGEDYQKYPRDVQSDTNHLKQLKVDAVFAPSTEEIYPQAKHSSLSGGEGDFIRFDFGYLSTILCAKSRKNFFTGVALVIVKLFNIIKPDLAIFGQKDYQQFCVIEKINNELNFDIELKIAPISRDLSGLALSSRNQYLSCDQKLHASKIYQLLEKVDARLKKLKKTDSNEWISTVKITENWARNKLNQLSFEIDYFALLNYPDLLPIQTQSKKMIALIAVYLDGVRLIDNKIIQFD